MLRERVVLSSAIRGTRNYDVSRDALRPKRLTPLLAPTPLGIMGTDHADDRAVAAEQHAAWPRRRDRPANDNRTGNTNPDTSLALPRTRTMLMMAQSRSYSTRHDRADAIVKHLRLERDLRGSAHHRRGPILETRRTACRTLTLTDLTFARTAYTRAKAGDEPPLRGSMGRRRERRRVAKIGAPGHPPRARNEGRKREEDCRATPSTSTP